MGILAIETSNNVCGAAFIDKGCVVAEKNLILPKNSSSEIFRIVRQVSGNKKISAVAVDIGPGSFTGIRIGVSLARAYSQFLKIPAAGIPSLDCLVYNAVKRENIGGDIYPLIDALRDEVYTAHFTGIKRNSQYRIIKICDLKKYFAKGAVIVGNSEILKKINGNYNRVETDFSASAVGYLAIEIIKGKRCPNFKDILPFYMRRSFAEECSAAKQSKCAKITRK